MIDFSESKIYSTTSLIPELVISDLAFFLKKKKKGKIDNTVSGLHYRENLKTNFSAAY